MTAHDASAGSEGEAPDAVRLDHRGDASPVGRTDARVEIRLEHLDQTIARIAAVQDAVITYEQLRALGLGRGAIASRRRRGLLYPVHVGVYRWGLMQSPRTRVRAAVLACAGDALATHHAPLALYGLRALPEGPVDVTTVGRHVAPRGVRPHTTRSLDPADRRILGGIPVTSPARALLEVAAELTPRELAEVVERAQVKRLVTKADLIATIARAPRRAGVAALRALAEDPAFTRSRAERKVVALMRAAQLPEPVFNAYAEGLEVDVLWRRERVVLEFDSYGFHATRSAFDRDRRRDATLQRARYLVLRTTWTELTRQSYALVARLALALSGGGATFPASPARGGP